MKKVGYIKSDNYSYAQINRIENKNSFINTGIQLHKCKENLVEQNNMRIADIKDEKKFLVRLERKLENWKKIAFGKKISNVNMIECLDLEEFNSMRKILSSDMHVNVFKDKINYRNCIYFVIYDPKNNESILAKDIITKIKNEQITQLINDNKILISNLNQEKRLLEQQNIEMQNNKPLDVQDFGVMHEIHQEIPVGSDFEFNLLVKGLKKEVDSNFEFYKKNDFSTSLNQFGQEFQNTTDGISCIETKYTERQENITVKSSLCIDPNDDFDNYDQFNFEDTSKELFAKKISPRKFTMDESSPSHYLEGYRRYSPSQRNKDLSDMSVGEDYILEEDAGSINSKKSIDISPVRCNEDFENVEFLLRIKKQAIKPEKEKKEIDLEDLVECSRDMYEEKPQKPDTKKNNAKAKVEIEIKEVKIDPKNTKTSIKKEEITNQLIDDRVSSKNRTINKRIIHNYNYNSNSYTDKILEIQSMLKNIYELIDRILSISRNNYYYKAKIFSLLHKKY